MGRAHGVHQHVALAPTLVEERERGFDLAGVEEVAFEADGVFRSRREQLVLGLAQMARGPGEHRDPGALGREHLGGGPPHPARPARHDGGAALESEVHQGLQSAGELSGEVRGREWLAGRAFDQLVPTERRSGGEHVAGEQRAGVAPVDEPVGAGREGGVEL